VKKWYETSTAEILVMNMPLHMLKTELSTVTYRGSSFEEACRFGSLKYSDAALNEVSGNVACFTLDCCTSCV